MARFVRGSSTHPTMRTISDIPTRPEALLDDAEPRDSNNLVRFFVYGESCFLAAMLACCAIEPSWLAVERGLSYYGTRLTTIVPYTAGFALCIGLTTIGLVGIRDGAVAFRRFRRAVALVLVLMAMIPLTPYSVDRVFDWLHIGVAAILFTVGFALGAGLALRLLRDRYGQMLFALQTVGFIAICAAQAGLNNYMIPSELCFQLAFVGLIVRGVRRLSSSADAPFGTLVPTSPLADVGAEQATNREWCV